MRGMVAKVTSHDATAGGNVLNEVGFAYDDFGQLREDAQEHDGAVDGNTLRVLYAHADGTGNTARRLSMTYPDGREIDYGYGTSGSIDDVLSRVASLAVNGEAQDLVAYTFVGAARYVEIAYPEPGIGLSYLKNPGEPEGDSGDPYTGYDRFGRTVDMKWQTPGGGTMLDRVQYGYDRASSRTWRRDTAAPAGHDAHYRYDPLHQVTQASQGVLNLNQTAIGGIPAQEENFDYDPTGNWDRYHTAEDGTETLDQSRKHNKDNQITQIDGSSQGILHDPAGQAIQMPPDVSGDWSKYYRLVWDAWGRIVEIKDEEDETVATYAYDGIMRRIARTAGGTTTHCYYNEKWKAVEEREGSSSDPSRQHLWGARPNHRDELIRRDRDTSGNGTLDERLYCLMDYYDPIAMVDATGAAVERYEFSAFGLRTVMDAGWSETGSSAFGVDFAFHGQFLDEETGYYDYGYRYYSPHLGRWLSRDPIEEEGGVNLYLIALNNSINHLDRFGLSSIVGALIYLVARKYLLALAVLVTQEIASAACKKIKCCTPREICVITTKIAIYGAATALTISAVTACINGITAIGLELGGQYGGLAGLAAAASICIPALLAGVAVLGEAIITGFVGVMDDCEEDGETIPSYLFDRLEEAFEEFLDSFSSPTLGINP